MGGPGSGRHGGARDASTGKFITVGLDITGADKVSQKLEQVSESTKKLKDSTKDGTTATDANTSSTDKNTGSKSRNRQEQNNLIDAQTRSVIMLQASTSALNQGVGATYKMIAGLEAMGLRTNEQAQAMQKFVRQLEFFTGLLELGLSIVTIHTTMTELNTGARAKNAVATTQQAAAQIALNSAIRGGGKRGAGAAAGAAAVGLSPMMILLGTTLGLIGAFAIFSRGINNTKTRVELLTEALHGLHQVWSDILTLENPFEGAFESRFGAEARGNKTHFLRELMGA